MKLDWKINSYIVEADGYKIYNTKKDHEATYHGSVIYEGSFVDCLDFCEFHYKEELK